MNDTSGGNKRQSEPAGQLVRFEKSLSDDGDPQQQADHWVLQRDRRRRLETL